MTAAHRQREHFVCYLAYRPTGEERQAQERFIQEGLARPDALLAQLYREWIRCSTLHEEKAPARSDATIAEAARQLLSGKLARLRNKSDCEQFFRFARLFLDAFDRGGALVPYYGIMDAYWRGVDVIPGSQKTPSSSRILLLPQPTSPNIPQLEWVFNHPLPKNAIVCAAWDIHFADEQSIESGRLGRIVSSGSSACNVQFQDYPYIVLCLRDMLMLPTADLPRAVRPSRCR